MAKDDQQDELCPAGKVLEVEFNAGINRVKESAERMEASCEKVSIAVQRLTEYAVRDKERIDALEKSRDCKSKKLKELQENVQGMEVSLEAHLEGHKVREREQEVTERVKSRLALAGLSSGPATLGIFEVLKFLITGKWG